jgi:hypothetical protein
MADTISLLVLDTLQSIMQGTVIESTVAGALVMQPNCCNADCWTIIESTVAGALVMQPNCCNTDCYLLPNTL